MMLTWKIFVTIMSMVSLTLQMNTSGSGSSPDPTQFKFYDKESDRYYPIIYNKYNDFPIGTVAYECFAKIRLFCQSKSNYVKSDECAKNGMLFYRTIPNRPIDCADTFFQTFPLVIGNFKLPEAFCRGKGYMAQECSNYLQQYIDLVEAPRHEFQETVESAERKSRTNIGKIAFIHKDILELDAENFERKYLEHISEHVSSSNLCIV